MGDTVNAVNAYSDVLKCAHYIPEDFYNISWCHPKKAKRLILKMKKAACRVKAQLSMDVDW